MKGEGYLAFYPVTMLKVSQLGEGLEAEKQPPPNKIMNGLPPQQTPQQYMKAAGRGGSLGLRTSSKVTAPPARAINKGSQCPPFLQDPLLSWPWSQGSWLPCPSSLQESVTEKPLRLPQGKPGLL